MTRLMFGKHKGWLLSEVPTEYLAWVCRTNMRAGNYFVGIGKITEELKRRSEGQKLTTHLEITHHALHRAELRLGKIYREKHKPNEGLKKWLERVFLYVLKHGEMRKSYKSRFGKRFMQPRYEYFLRDTVRELEWKFVTEGNDAYQKLVTVFAPGYTNEGRKKA